MACPIQLFSGALCEFSKQFCGAKNCLLKYPSLYLNFQQTHEYGSVLNMESNDFVLLA